MGSLVDMAIHSSVGCQALPYVEVASCWWRSWVTRWLSVEPWGVLGLLLVHWWAEPGSGVGSCETWVPGSSVSCQWVGLGPNS